MDTNTATLDQICFDLQLDDQTLDEINNMYVQQQQQQPMPQSLSSPPLQPQHISAISTGTTNPCIDLNNSATIDSFLITNNHFNNNCIINNNNNNNCAKTPESYSLGNTYPTNTYCYNNHNNSSQTTGNSDTNNSYMCLGNGNENSYDLNAINCKTSATDDSYTIDIEKCKLKLSTKFDDYCMKIIRDMNTIGVSVVDNFMEQLGEFVLQEVLYLYQTVVFSDGKVVNSAQVCEGNGMEKIRGDSIYWVNGSEPNCRFISHLMTTLDRIIFKCNKMNNNGLMGINSISSRTSAMVACYPGQESSYKQHADNTIADGRYITCIYYINKGWVPQRDGGLLRIYPSQVSGQQPLNISPEFDRLICFWSDRRNLHEVLPTKRLRFAITVWYFDDEERRRFRQRKLHQTP